MKTILIHGGRIIDPARGLDSSADVLLEGGKVKAVGKDLGAADIEIDAGGKLVTPGLIDLHVHLREPGEEAKETIATGSASAAAGGFTTICAMPNTTPPTDNAATVEFVLRQAKAAAGANILPVGAITKGRAGAEPADLEAMVRGGAVAFSDDGCGVDDAEVLREAMTIAAALKRPIMSHCEDQAASAGGVMNAGHVAALLGIAGIPAEAEESQVRRDIEIARRTGCRLHISHVSTAGSVEIIRRAKGRGVALSAEATPHHISLTDECVRTGRPVYKMKPPLRSAEDVAAIKEGLRDAAIDCLASDHAPHGTYREDLAFADAPFGIIGLESALAVYIAELIEPGILDWPRLVAAMSANPARVLGLSGKGTLAPGADADLTIIDPDVAWTIDAGTFRSRSRNCPFDGRCAKGRNTLTIVGGRIVFRLG
ncbi:MAG: dihydroorotase [Phycisphaerae bacterium]|jgi:dihydroorotase|nr:dihydroorotase [Phycisphaerae bacterium]